MPRRSIVVIGLTASPPGRSHMPVDSACPDFRRSAFSRRRLLQVGAAGLLGLSLPDWLRAAERSRGSSKARAKAVIFLHQFGGPSQFETFDMKPAAPAEV